jgi:hypothetical protein
MKIPAWLVVLALAVIVVLSVILTVVALVWVNYRRNTRRRAKAAVLRDLPRFGLPVLITYSRAMFEGPLRCAGEGCGHRFIRDGEEFYEVPVTNREPGAILPVCRDCSENSSAASPKV